MELKKGDRVRVCWIDEYNKGLMLQFAGCLPIGKTGTIDEVRFNHNMAVYGKEKEILVRMDDAASNVTEIWYEKNLELI